MGIFPGLPAQKNRLATRMPEGVRKNRLAADSISRERDLECWVQGELESSEV